MILWCLTLLGYWNGILPQRSWTRSCKINFKKTWVVECIRKFWLINYFYLLSHALSFLQDKCLVLRQVNVQLVLTIIANQSILKEISPGCSLEGLTLKLKLQYFGRLMRRLDSLEKTLMPGQTGGRRRRGRQRMRWLDGITDLMGLSLSKRSLWWTGRSGVLWFMGLQRVGHDWATELNWTELIIAYPALSFYQVYLKAVLAEINHFVRRLKIISATVQFSFPFCCFPLFLCIDCWGRLSYLSLLFFGTLHSSGYIFAFSFSSFHGYL